MDEASTFRWVLIIAGVLLLAGLMLFGNPNRKKKPRRQKKIAKRKRANRRKARETERREPTLEVGALDEGLTRFESADFEGPDTGAQESQGELPIGGNEPSLGPNPVSEPTPAAPPPEKVVVLYLQARDNRRVSGVELLDAAIKSGMKHGDMEIFHRHVPDDDRPVFSMANLTPPGTFDRDAWNTFETKGMTLFMGLPGPLSALDAWDAMVATARRMAELLHLDVLDDKRAHFTRQREGEIREELRTFERSQLPEA